jgi:alpha-tubulin suppressor-like RCC1 family protein
VHHIAASHDGSLLAVTVDGVHEVQVLRVDVPSHTLQLQQKLHLPQVCVCVCVCVNVHVHVCLKENASFFGSQGASYVQCTRANIATRILDPAP